MHGKNRDCFSKATYILYKEYLSYFIHKTIGHSVYCTSNFKTTASNRTPSPEATSSTWLTHVRGGAHLAERTVYTCTHFKGDTTHHNDSNCNLSNPGLRRVSQYLPLYSQVSSRGLLNHLGSYGKRSSSRRFRLSRCAPSNCSFRFSAVVRSPSSRARWSGRKRVSVGGSRCWSGPSSFSSMANLKATRISTAAHTKTKCNDTLSLVCMVTLWIRSNVRVLMASFLLSKCIGQMAPLRNTKLQTTFQKVVWRDGRFHQKQLQPPEHNIIIHTKIETISTVLLTSWRLADQ